MENTIFTELMECAVLNNDFLCWQPGSIFLLMLPFLPGTAEGLKILPKIHSAALHRNTPKIYLNKEPRWRLFTGYIFILNFIIIGVKKKGSELQKGTRFSFFIAILTQKKSSWYSWVKKKKRSLAWTEPQHSVQQQGTDPNSPAGLKPGVASPDRHMMLSMTSAGFVWQFTKLLCNHRLPRLLTDAPAWFSPMAGRCGGGKA